MIDGVDIPVFVVEFGAPHRPARPKSGVGYVVSTITAQAAARAGRTTVDLFTPDGSPRPGRQRADHRRSRTGEGRCVMHEIIPTARRFWRQPLRSGTRCASVAPNRRLATRSVGHARRRCLYRQRQRRVLPRPLRRADLRPGGSGVIRVSRDDGDRNAGDWWDLVEAACLPGGCASSLARDWMPSVSRRRSRTSAG